jgi:hypothetical protein
MSILHVLAFLFCGNSSASNLGADNANVNIIASQTTATSISISSHVHLSPNITATLQGPLGYVTSRSSINASSFWGDGRLLSGTINPSADVTFSGSNTFLSTFSVQSGGREIILSTSATTKNIDISSTGIILFSPELHNSSATAIPEFTTTNQNLSTCITGSTLTITTSGGRVELLFSGIITSTSPTNSTQQFALGFLQDGSPITGQDSHKGIIHYSGGFYQSGSAASFRYIVSAPSSATHSYCLSIAAVPSTGGSVTLLDSSGLENPLAFGPATGRNFFFIKEIK